VGVDKIQVERPRTPAELEQFAAFPHQVYSARIAWWPPDIRGEVELLRGRAPISSSLEISPFWVKHGGKVVARVSAVINYRYQRHWNERLGHLIHFEALPNETESVVAMLDEACRWLQERGAQAARSGFATFLDYPYAIDNYEGFPSFLLRSTPDYYHSYFKNAGFYTEKGMVDYTIALTEPILERYRAIVSAAPSYGFEVLSWRRYGFNKAIEAWTTVTNAAFAKHWGWNPVAHEEVRPTLAPLEATEVADLSVVAVAQGEAVGVVFALPDLSLALARIRPGFKLAAERGGGSRGALINIGVIESWRGRTVNLAMAAESFLAMAKRAMKYAGYTLVLDDNWPSRKTAEKLGGRVTSNFVVYRRDFTYKSAGA